MKLKIFCRCSLFSSWSDEGLISTPVLRPKKNCLDMAAIIVD